SSPSCSGAASTARISPARRCARIWDWRGPRSGRGAARVEATTMGYHLRLADPDDAAAVRQLVREAYAKWVPVIGREPKAMMADYGLAIQNHIIDLLFDDDLLIGLIEFVVEPHGILIENVAVRPNEAGKGHGRRLMAHAVDFARSLGRRRLR